VGPYAVIRTTRRISSFDAVMIVAPVLVDRPDALESWSSHCIISCVHAQQKINLAGNAKLFTMPLSGLGHAVTLVPSAITVQVMNGSALQTTSGMVYMGVMNTQAHLAGRDENWADWADKFVQYQAPRMLSAGKLALRGVRCNSYPLNMTRVSQFAPMSLDADVTAGSMHDNHQPSGWAPIVIYNTQGAHMGHATPLALEVLVTMEWRVRFDLDHPASSSHRHHAVSSDYTWDTLSRYASSIGSGVTDIADVVSNVGSLARALMPRGAPNPGEVPMPRFAPLLA
jgi:hypothetical protein